MSQHGLLWTGAPIETGHPLNHGLVGWWSGLAPLGGGPRFVDLCGVAHGTLTSFATSTAAWVRSPLFPGLALEATNTLAHVRCAGNNRFNTPNAPFAWSFWGKWPSPSLGGFFIAKTTGSVGADILVNGNNLGNNSITIRLSNTDGARWINSQVGSNTWIHYVFIRNQGGTRLYTNGILQDTRTHNVNLNNTSAPLNFFGRNNSGNTQVGAGIADVRIHQFADVSSPFTGAPDRWAYESYDSARRGHLDLLRWVRPATWFVPESAPPPATNRRRRILICGGAA